jgi:TubC N-terminal docking domain
MGAAALLADLTGAGLTVTVDGDRLVIRPASKLTPPLRAALREAKPELLMLLARPAQGCQTPGKAGAAMTCIDAACHSDRRARLLRWGWPPADADALAARLVARDRAADLRVSCTECRHFQPGRCSNFRRAGLTTPALGKDLAALLQHCPGFVAVSGPAVRQQP